MIYHLEFVPNHGLYQLHIDVINFFNQARRYTRYNSAQLYTNELLNVVNASHELRRIFKRVFRELNQPGIQKGRVYTFLESNNRVENIVSGTRYPILKLPSNDSYDSLMRSIRELFDHLWRKTIGTATCNNNYGSIDDHYQEFYTLNDDKKICAFCGLEKLKRIKEQRNEYDHYLYKADYPWASINFLNLVPMCDTCNKSPNKGIKNMIINENTGNRRLAYYPYSPVKQLQVTTTSSDFLGANERFDVRTSCARNIQAFVTWKNVFRINIRYQDYTLDMHETWIKNLYKHHNKFNTLPKNVTELRTRIRQYRSYRQELERQEGDHLEFAFWKFLEETQASDLRLLLDYFDDISLVLAA